MGASRDVYAAKALAQLPRLLGLQDRNPFSPTYGCFHRDYWLDKTSDFPDAVRQFGVHALALAWACDFPGNFYRGRPKLRDWTVAGLDFWARIQHRDGSFDEFYPYERGWSGPTAFTTYTAIEACALLGDALPAATATRVREAVRRAARFIAAGEAEEDHLANHHAIACLAVWKAYRMLGDESLRAGYERLWRGFLGYLDREEGWTREYDGVDPGYLSATVSFLGKLWQVRPDDELLAVLQRLVAFCAWFVYPDGSYAGSLGSRNTMHFYAHGFELLAGRIPLAAAIAERTLAALGEGKLVPPEIMGDRYVFYRVPELLQAYLDWSPRPAALPLLPSQRGPFTRWFPHARIFVANRRRHHVVANLAKGGVVRVFDRATGESVLNDAGIIGRLDDGRVVTSQWVDPDHRCTAGDDGWTVSGVLHAVPSDKLFNPLRSVLFRSTLLGIGWSPRLSHVLKGGIRRSLMLGRRPVPVRFRRTLRLSDDGVALESEVVREGDVRFTDLSVGDEFFVRYVPQSRYFQPHELSGARRSLDPEQLAQLNAGRPVRLAIQVGDDAPAGTVEGDGSVTTTPGPEFQRSFWEGSGRRRTPADPIIAAFVEPKLEFILRHAELPPRARLLDVGCGNGYFTHYLERLGVTVGIDYARKMLESNPCDHRAQGSALRLPFRDGAFDLVLCSNLLHHVERPGEVVAEMRRVSGRYVVLHEPNRYNPAMLALGLAKREERRSLRFTEPFLRELAGAAGLEVVASGTLGFVTPNRMPAPVARLLGRIRRAHRLAAFSVVVARRG